VLNRITATSVDMPAVNLTGVDLTSVDMPAVKLTSVDMPALNDLRAGGTAENGTTFEDAFPSADGRRRRHAATRSASFPRGEVLTRIRNSPLLAPTALACALALFFPAFYGNDSSNVMSKSQVDTTSSFLESAQPGLIMYPIADTSLSDTAKYNEFPSNQIFGEYGILETSPSKVNIATYLARTVVNYTNGTTPAYVLFTPSMTATNAAYGYVSTSDVNELVSSIKTSPYWKPIVNVDGTVVYEITTAADDLGAGPYNSNPIFSVP
jgi:hypothetical protein